MRLEIQLGRLGDYLSKEKDTQTKLMMERQITDIESKLLRADERILESNIAYISKVAKGINDYAEAQKLDYRVVNMQELIKVSPEGFRSYLTILRRERIIA